jgi:hypothetical protein
MPTALMETRIERSADDVWAEVRVFEDMHWYPGIASCRRDGDLRVATMVGGLECDEQLVEHDDVARTYTYAVLAFRGETVFEVGGATIDLASMAGHHRARMAVVPLDGSSCRVTYELELDDGHDETFDLTCGQYRAVIEHLKSLVER